MRVAVVEAADAIKIVSRCLLRTVDTLPNTAQLSDRASPFRELQGMDPSLDAFAEMAEKLWLVLALFEVPEGGDWHSFLQGIYRDLRALALSLRELRQYSPADDVDTIARALAKSWIKDGNIDNDTDRKRGLPDLDRKTGPPSASLLLDMDGLESYVQGGKGTWPLSEKQVFNRESHRTNFLDRSSEESSTHPRRTARSVIAES